MEGVNPEILRMVQEQDAAKKAALAERTSRLENMLAERATAAASVNLSPMAAFADSMAGTKVAGGVAEQARSGEGFQKRTDDLFDQLNALKGATSETNIPLSLLKPGNEEDKYARQQDSQVQQAFRDLADQTRKISDSVLDAGTNANKMRAAFQTRDPRQVMPAMNELARTIQDVKGSMSEGDVNRSFFTDLETKIQVALTKAGADGKISDEAIAPVLAQLDRFQGKVAEVGKKKLDRVKTMYRGNDAYNTAFGQLQSGGAFDSLESNIKAYAPPEQGVAPATATAAPASTGMFGFDPDSILKSRAGKK